MAGDPWPYGCGMVWPGPSSYQPPNPKVMPVNLPFSTFGVTIAVMDSSGNITIKVDQPRPEDR